MAVNPIFICTSATIKNPKELAENLTNTKHELITKSGAPVGKKTFIFYNPPIVHPTFGVRSSAVLEVRDLSKRLFEAGIQTIIFAKSRVRVEMLVTYLKSLTKNKIQMNRFKAIEVDIYQVNAVQLKKVCVMARFKWLLVQMRLNLVSILGNYKLYYDRLSRKYRKCMATSRDERGEVKMKH